MKKNASAGRQRTEPPKAARRKMPALAGPRSFPIVGIGASAGGLEALEQFLGRVPAGSGMAFIIVQHLDPTRKGVMPELLQRITAMKVIQVKDRTRVEPNWVYVIPPNKDMSILHGILHLLEPAPPRGLRLPIDFFLRSLAQDQQERSIGVILSGMGSDGTLGLRAIKENGGLVLVQDPATAKFDGMPRSATDSGLADIVARAEDLPERIISYLQRTPLVHAPELALEDNAQSGAEKAIILLRAHTGHDFSLYKKSAFYRRIERRMGIHQIDKIAGYVRYLQENSQELDLLFKELLIGVTSFFRDPAAWEELRRRILPALIAQPAHSPVLRAWVPGCSTGEEAYSLAMVFKEVMEKTDPRNKRKLQVFATDLDKDAIEKARHGIYPENICADVTPTRMSRFFTKEARGFRVVTEIREMVIFAPQNVIMDPPFTKLDIVSCRNLLIYLSPELQKKLILLFHYCLSPGGILFLGSAETAGACTDRFKPISGKLRIFRRAETVLRQEAIEFPSSFGFPSPVGPRATPSPKPHLSLQALAEQLVLECYAPPSLLVDDKGNILYVSGRTGKYLEPAAGKANWNIFAMARPGLRHELEHAFHRVLGRESSVVIRGLNVGTDGAKHPVDIALRRIEEPESLHGLVIVVFTDLPAPPGPSTPDRRENVKKAQPGRGRLQERERKYQQARLELQSAREEMQTTQEELRSANEEMQSTNEELQSTNEQLTTSKEEMQSLNEELQTVNTELQAKVDELLRSDNDMKNLLNSTDIATVFLDSDLHVRRFTTQATKIIKLIPGDVGRPITDLASDLLYSEMTKDARAVLRNLDFTEKSIATRDGRWFTVRIMPYRTLDDRIDGVVITFSDITAGKTVETQLRKQHAILEQHVAGQSTKAEKAKARISTKHFSG